MPVEDLDQGHLVVVPFVDASLSEYIKEDVAVHHVEGFFEVEEEEHFLTEVLGAVQLQQRVCDVGAGALSNFKSMLVPHRGEEVVVPVVLNSIKDGLLHVLGDV